MPHCRSPLGGAARDPPTEPQPATQPNAHDLPDTLPLQRQQQRLLARLQDDQSSTTSSQRALRRTPRFHTPSPSPRPVEPRRVHIEAASVGIRHRPLLITTGGPTPPRHAPSPSPSAPRRQLSQDLSDGDDNLEEASSLLPAYSPAWPLSPERERDPHPVVRVSKHTKSAILWALEEALRQPNAFSPDIVEENASMADLIAGTAAGPATSNGNGASSTRPTAPPAQTGSPSQVIRGPRVIMRERAEREARQRAQREQLERERAETEALLMEQTRQRLERAAAGAAAGGDTDPATQRRRARQESQSTPRIPASAPPPHQQQAPAAAPAPLRPTRVPTTTSAPQGFSAGPQPGASVPQPAQTGEASAQGPGAARVKNAFPHAFERWEALSAHWEGMTSFWIRKLQENTEELDRNPLSAQLSRQVGDLSAAGANLFHAVVELQRLRASSERKFQRWFFETRSELERNQEVNAMLEAQLEEQRQGWAEAKRDLAMYERENQKLQKLQAEQRKELLISKEEARRAWEELGRREQEERDRTTSLQQGHTTIVGGVAVVPMTQGVPSRYSSHPSPQQQRQPADTSQYVAAQGGGGGGGAHYPEYSQPPPAPQPASAAQYAHHSDVATAQETGHYGPGSETGYSEGEYVIDEHGNFVRDAQGNRVPYRSAHSPGRPAVRAAEAEVTPVSEFETPPATTTQGQSGVGNNPATSYPPSSSQYYAGQDYSGQGYWENRHHHPTRLSDVMEEDERSRTSASQVSRAER
ncbi:hypothetical protein QBC39DRAFT_402141 [Podospora conica]|nr:hypothetical protein QBC39DRAFT_402141 [Schizothecium conicum]